MNHKVVGLTLFACVGSIATLAAAAGIAVNADRPKLMAAAAAANPVQRQVLGMPLSKAERSNTKIAKIDATLNRLRRESSGAASAAAPTAATVQTRKQSGLLLRTDAPHTVPSVLVNFTVTGNAQTVKAQLAQLDARHLTVFSNVISGWLPTDRIADAAALSGVHLMRAALAHTSAGSVQTQGDFIEHGDLLRATPLVAGGLDGTGVTVGILSDSFDCQSGYLADRGTGDLPAGVNVLAEEGDSGDGTGRCDDAHGYKGADEGRAMAQIIYDIAPGTQLAFHTAFDGEADFAQGILDLATIAGAKVIADDVYYADEPLFQDGIVGQAINQVAASGVSYFSSAGNDGLQAWEGQWVDSGAVGATSSAVDGGNQGEKLMQFTGADGTKSNFLPINYYPAQYVLTPILQWDQPYFTGAPDSGGATSSMNICATDAAGTVMTEEVTDPDTGETIVYSDCSGLSMVGGDSVSIAQFVTPGTDIGGLAISLASGTKAPGLVHIRFSDDGFGTQATPNFATYSGTIQGHAQAEGASAMAATYFRANAICNPGFYPAYELEDFSSGGGTATLFAADGTPLKTPVVRNKPNLTAPDGVATTFFGQQLGVRTSKVTQCDNSATVYNFFGTSAAAPHAAGAAALLLQAQPAATPLQIQTALQDSAAVNVGRFAGYADDGSDLVDVEPVPNFDAGYGLIQADLAVVKLLPTATLDPTSLSFDQAVVTTTSAAQTATLTNTSVYPLLISSISTATDFPATSDCPIAPASLAAGAKCTLTVSFAPTVSGTLKESIVITSNAAPNAITLALSGTAINPQITVTPAALTFTQAGQTDSGFTKPQTVTVTSTGDAALTISSISINGEFQQSNTCPASLAAGASCTVSVSMSTSLDTLTKSGALLVASNASNASTATVALDGTISRTSSGGTMPFWLLLPGLAAFAARRRKRPH